MATNEFLQFCPTDTGTNLLSESDYTAAADRVSGNKPGVASAKLNNKALRQSSVIASQLAQLMSDQLNSNVVDDGSAAKILAQVRATLKPFLPNVSKLTSGSGSFDLNYVFFIATGSATAAATYTNNGKTFTVVTTVSGATEIRMTGTGAPTVTGTLTKASGTGDATLSFYAVRAPLFLEVEMVGAGGGGAGSGAGAGSGGAGSDTTFGTSFLTCTTGDGGSVTGAGADGGTATITGPTGISAGGAPGSPTGANVSGGSGGTGGSSPFGGGGKGALGGANTAGTNAKTNSGSGGGGAAVSGGSGGGGGASGAYIKVRFTPADAPYAYTVSAGGAAGAGANAGGAGGAGLIVVTEFYQ